MFGEFVASWREDWMAQRINADKKLEDVNWELDHCFQVDPLA